MIRAYLAKRKWLRDCKRLHKLVTLERNSYKCVQYRKKREAGKKGWAMRQQSCRRSGALRAEPNLRLSQAKPPVAIAKVRQ